MPNNTGTDRSVTYGELKALGSYEQVQNSAVRTYGDEAKAADVAEQTRKSEEG